MKYSEIAGKISFEKGTRSSFKKQVKDYIRSKESSFRLRELNDNEITILEDIIKNTEENIEDTKIRIDNWIEEKNTEQYETNKNYEKNIKEYLRKEEDSEFLYDVSEDEDRRNIIAESMANNIGCQLIKIDPTTPITKKLSKLTISDPEIDAAFDNLKKALLKHSPELIRDFELTGKLVIENTGNNLSFSSPDDQLKKERPSNLKPNLSSPTNLNSKFDQYEGDNENIFSLEKIRKLENSFRTNYDDSSDSEDEVDSVDATVNFDKYRENIAQGSEKYKESPYWRISFYLHVLGMMMIRSKSANKFYQPHKHTHLSLSEGDFLLFKKNVYDAFQEQQLNEKVNKENFEKIIWPLFIEKFRHFSKNKNSLDKILKKALKEVLMYLFNQKKIGSDKELMLQELVEKIKPRLPERISIFNREITITNNENPDHQIIAIIRFLYRLTRRNAKNFVDGTPDSIFKINFINTNMTEKFHLTTKKNGKCTRRDEVDLGFKGTSYPDLLSSRNKNGVRHFPSIAKYTDPDSKRSDRVFAEEMYAAAHGTSFDDQSYLNFLRKFYYLLQRAESGRNPASLIINIMLFQLVRKRKYKWSEILPASDEQKNMFSNVHPVLIHPMTFKDAPKAAAVLIEHFDDAIEQPLKYYPHQDINGYDNNLDAANVIAMKQYYIVNAWFSCFKEKNLEGSTNEEVTENLCEIVNSYYTRL